jgi:hypothetical protein
VAQRPQQPARRGRYALGLASRLSALLTIVAALALPLQGSPSTALATHTLTTQTPTPTPWPAGGGAGPWQATPTPTPFGWGPFQPAQGQTQFPGAPNQTNPGTTGQQSVSAPSYSGVPNAGSVPASGALPGSVVSGASSAMAGGSDVCRGDELITFSPETPRIGNELLIVVTSAHPHPYGRLAGTESTQFVRERPGQRGFVWEWTVQPSYPGQHEYTFYVDSTVPCQKVQIRVLQALSTRTPTPTKTATPWGWDNGNGNSNSNGNNNSNDNFTFATSVAFAPVVDPSVYVTPGQDVHNCWAFESQSNAQRVLRYDPTDPNNLDAEDGSIDGIACLNWSYSFYPNDRDTTPVARVTQTATMVATSTPTPVVAPTQTPTPTLTPTPVPFNPANYVTQGDHYGCGDFASHAQAQAVLRYDPTDPNRLDTNPRDGMACGGIEAQADGVPAGMMPPPLDLVRVPR